MTQANSAGAAEFSKSRGTKGPGGGKPQRNFTVLVASNVSGSVARNMSGLCFSQYWRMHEPGEMATGDTTDEI